MSEQKDINEAACGGSALTAELGLKPCPFCGETPELSKHFREDMWQMIHRCKVIGPMLIEWGDAERITKQWNKRAPNA